MIVISGVLVLVALVLLIIGVVGPDLTFVYASIGVSLVSLVFLVIGILQRRGDAAPADGADAPAPEVTEQPTDEVTTVIPAQAARSTSRRVTEEAPVAQSAAEEPELGGTVLVVEGRPRYHVQGCRYLAGKSAEAVDVLDARDEGFSPCGVCKPDDALAAATPAEPEEVVEEEVVEEEVVEEDVPGVEVPVATRTATRAAKAPVTKAPVTKAPVTKAPVTKAPAAKAPVTEVPAAKVPARAAGKAAAAPASRAVKAPATAVVNAPSKAAVAATAATPAAATAAKKAGSVVVIPDRGKFHRAECRYVRDVDGAEVLSKSAATRQGYAACGVCKP